MRPPIRTTLALAAATVALTGALVVADRGQPAAAFVGPQFKVMCAATGMAPDDPIVFPGQPGKSHMHTFFSARSVNAGTTTASLLGLPESACGSNFGIDRSAYWVPTLYQDGQPVYSQDAGVVQLTAYYERAGGSSGALVQQALPQGLRMIAGDVTATTPQDAVWFKCARVGDSGNQSQLRQDFPTCGKNEHVILELHFPDCWDGVNLDSANHKSHMAYSGGSNATCPADHPVKVPQIVFEVWYYGVTGSGLSFSSGGPYSFHGDVFSAWDPRAAAGLVDECINKNVDCTPLRFDQISMASVTQAQIDAQLTPGRSAAAAPPAASGSGSGSSGATADPGTAGHDHAAATTAPAAGAAHAAATGAATPAGDPTTSDPAAGATTDAATPAESTGSATPRSSSSALATESSAHGGHAATLAATGSPDAGSRPGWPVGAGLAAGVAGLGAGSFVLWRRRPH
jgi:hypothetical protein